MAVIRTLRVEPTARVVIGKVAVVAPCAMVTVAGTVTEGSEAVSAIT